MEIYQWQMKGNVNVNVILKWSEDTSSTIRVYTIGNGQEHWIVVYQRYPKPVGTGDRMLTCNRKLLYAGITLLENLPNKTNTILYGLKSGSLDIYACAMLSTECVSKLNSVNFYSTKIRSSSLFLSA